MSARYKQKSSQLQNDIKQRLGKTVPWRHDFIVHHLGLDGLREDEKGLREDERED